jgi:hypothetical protein
MAGFFVRRAQSTAFQHVLATAASDDLLKQSPPTCRALPGERFFAIDGQSATIKLE